MSEGVDHRRVALLSFFIGIAAGAFGGLLGVGGGVIMVPLLTSVAGLTQHEAHAASLAGTVVTGLGGALTYAADQAVDFRVALILASVSVFATYAVAYHAARVPALKLRGVFGGFLILAAVLLIARDELLGLRAPAGSLTTIFLIATGLLVGVAAGLLGVGGGALMVPLLVIGVGMTQHVAQGTSLAAMIPSGVSGTFAHWRTGALRRDAVLGLAPGTILGSWTGGQFALGMAASTLQIVFAVALTLLGINYILGVRRTQASRRAG